MCSQCLTKSVSYGEILPSEASYRWFLHKATKDEYAGEEDCWKAGQWGLIQVNDPSFIYPGEFYDSKVNEEKHFENLDLLDKALDSMDVMTSHQFVESCIQGGYNPAKHGSRISSWFMDRIARHLEETGKAVEKAH
jgi:hypothetical protein